jgi:predicted DsbA family dithiol-disulfide isomerase
MAIEERGGSERFNLTITRRPFFLYPGGEHPITRWGDRVDALYHPSASRSLVELGAKAGFHFNMDAPLSNTHDSHRLVLWAQRDTPGLGEALAEVIGHRYFEQRCPSNSCTAGAPIRLADRRMLVECAEAVGLDKEAALRYLESDAGHAEVLEAVEENRRVGITSIPLFRFSSGTFRRAVHGSANVEAFSSVLGEIEAHWQARERLEHSTCS